MVHQLFSENIRKEMRTSKYISNKNNILIHKVTKFAG